MTSTNELAGRFAVDRATWQSLVARVPRSRMDEPGPMGEWTFKDTVGHLLAWRNRGISRLEAAARGEPRPTPPWPADMEDDEVNAWFKEQADGRSVEDLLAEYDASFEQIARAVAALPASANPVESETAGYYRWTDATGALESDFFGHLAEHVADVEAWLAKG